MWGTYLARGVDTPPKPITCKAAVAWEPNKPLSIEVHKVSLTIFIPISIIDNHCGPT